jgi:hypothetical protein
MNDAASARPPRFFNLPFVLAVGMLAVAALLAGPVASRLQFRHAKAELPLRRPFSALSESSLGPYRVLDRHVLDPIVIEALGTEHYLSWTLEDISVDAHDPLRYASLLVTYYSGGENLVPHTPDVCYLGAGYQPARPHENTQIEVVLPGVDGGSIPVRVLTFGKTAIFDRQEVSVVYTFFCNGRFVNTRTGVRLLINDLSNTFAFFSKVEVSFPRATREQCVDGAEKLFTYVLPVLMRDHWPDFDAAEEEARSAAGADGRDTNDTPRSCGKG